MSGPAIILAARGNPGGPLSVVDLLRHPNNVFYVGNAVSGASDAAGYGLNPAAPFATIDYAINQCTASKGDVIYVLPYHNEGLGNAQIDLDVAGVSVIGLGRGAQVPRIDYDHASASFDVGANGCTIKNLRLLPSVTDVLIGIDVEAGVTDTLIEDVEALPGEDGAGVDDFALVVDIKAGCTRTTVRRLKVRQHASGAGYLAGVRLTGASTDCLVEDCDMSMAGTGLVAPINGITTLSTNFRALRNILVTDAEPGIELLTGTTGVLADNSIFGDLATIAAAIVADGCASFRNQYVEVGAESGAVIGTASVND